MGCLAASGGVIMTQSVVWGCAGKCDGCTGSRAGGRVLRREEPGCAILLICESDTTVHVVWEFRYCWVLGSVVCAVGKAVERGVVLPVSRG